MEKWVEIRRNVLVEGKSKRQVQRETGLAWKTLEKILTHSSPPGYRRTKPYPKPKLGPYVDRIAQIIEADREVPRKQRHTAKRIYERIREEGYGGGYTQVKAAARAIKRTKREVFFPLVHRPGEAQVDLGEALVKEGVAIRGRPEAEEVISTKALDESVGKAAFAYTDRWLGPREEIGSKGAGLGNRLRAALKAK